VAVVRTPHGVFLPGGGQAVGETPGEAALREVSEECGLEAHLLDVIGTADQFCFSEEERLYFRKRCTFFRGHIVRPCGDPEADHELLWLSSREAEVAMTHESQRWAVAEERRIANA
jgi:8-oxo-dGTP diphosphatase